MLSENLYFAKMAIKVDLKCVCLLAGKRSRDLKYLKTIFNENRLLSELFIYHIMRYLT